MARCLAIVALTAVLTPPLPLRGQTAEWFGTWRLDLDKSVYTPGPPPYRRATMTVEPWDGMAKFAYDFVLPRGGVQHMERTGRFDGRD